MLYSWHYHWNLDLHWWWFFTRGMQMVLLIQLVSLAGLFALHFLSKNLRQLLQFDQLCGWIFVPLFWNIKFIFQLWLLWESTKECGSVWQRVQVRFHALGYGCHGDDNESENTKCGLPVTNLPEYSEVGHCSRTNHQLGPPVSYPCHNNNMFDLHPKLA